MTRTRAGVDWDTFTTTDDEMRYGHDIRWQRTGIRNAQGLMILRRVDLPIGFRANHDMPTYAVDEDED